jgi:hypothetical protein
MENTDPLLLRAVRRLTTAVTVLSVLILVLVVLLAAPYVFWLKETAWNEPASDEAAKIHDDSLPSAVEDIERHDFPELPLSRKLELADAVVLARFEYQGDRYTARAAEILKHKPGIRLYVRAGDPIEFLGGVVEDDRKIGDGALCFYLGNPAVLRFSTSFHDEPVAGLAGISVAEVKGKLRALEEAGAAASGAR